MFAPNGPIRDDLNLKLEDFFWEPFYQLLRQQMLPSRWKRPMKPKPTACGSCTSRPRETGVSMP